MKNLVIAVSPDSSLELLKSFADIIILDKDLIPETIGYYDTIYIRSHFGQPSALPQNFRTEIDILVSLAKQENPDIQCIDDADTIDKIVACEDKWIQYQTYSKFMPRTQLLDNESNSSNFDRPIYKNRLSSRGNGVTWDIEKVTGPRQDWIIQESIDIAEELRIYVIRGTVYPIGAVRQSMTSERHAQAVDSRRLTQDEIDFSSEISKLNENMDFVGLDIARTSDGKLRLMEANRSPGFAAFEKLTNVNLASLLYTQ
jgi:glutathione synthase/RimK-type ligase-like ATP-grasp enzyme